MRLDIFTEYQNIAQKIIDEVNNPAAVTSITEYSSVKDMYKMSRYYNKIQNQNAIDGYSDDEVKTFMAFDSESDNVKYFTIKSNKAYTIKQWFVLCVCIEVCFDIQQIRSIVKNY